MQMIDTRTNVLLGAALGLALMVSPSAHGAALTWDTNGTAAGTGATVPVGTGTGYGTWGADAFWNPLDNGGGILANFVVNTTTVDTLRFSAGNNAPAAYAVAVTGNQGAASIAFQDGHATLSGAAIDLASAAVISGNGTINNNLTGAATSLTVNANSTTATITLGGANTYSGLTIIGNLLTVGDVGSKVVLTGSTSGSGGTRINNQNTLVLANAGVNSGLSPGLLTLGSNSSTASTAPTIKSSDNTSRSIASAIAFPTQQSSAVIFDGTGGLSFTNTGVVAMNSSGLAATRIFVVNNPVTTIAAAMSDGTNGSGVSKAGAGTLVLSGANTYTNATVVNAGALQIDGTVSSITGGVNVQNSGTLAGSGTILGSTSVGGVGDNAGGTLAVGGAGVDELTFDFDSTYVPSPESGTHSLAFTPGGAATFDLTGFGAGQFDIARGGIDAALETVGFNGTLNLAFTPGFNSTGFAEIFDFDGYYGVFSTVNATGLAPGYTASFDETTGIVSVIPEPGTIVLAGLGLLMVAGRRRA